MTRLPISRVLILASVGLASVTALDASPAASQRAASVQVTRGADMAALQSEYRDERVRALRLRADATNAAAEGSALNRQIAALRQAQSSDDAQMAAERARLHDLAQREAVLVTSLSRERGQQGRLLSALQMMSRDPPPPMLIPADKAVDTVRAAILLRAMAPELERRARILADRQVEVGRIRRLAVLASEWLVTTESAQGDRRGQIEALGVRKAALVAALRADADHSEAAARALEGRIRSLGGTIQAPNATEVDTGPVATRLPGGRSRLTPPVAGAPVAVFSKGLTGWRWRRGARTVAAPARARVDYAGPMSGYGQVVILDLGPGWRAVISGLDTVSVKTGSHVADGQAIGHTSPDGELYFELRRDERPIDPAPWLR